MIKGTIHTFKNLSRAQRHTFAAAVGGWALDAFDFFIFIFALKSIAVDFHTDVKSVSEGIFLTLIARPAGALFFGWLAEKYGRRPVLMANIVSYSVFELASAFAPDLKTLLVLRALFGFAMGGEWGVGSALALESLPAKGRGIFSGFIQQGYVIGFLLASALFAVAFEYTGWRGMFIVGAAPALLVFYIRSTVPESASWQEGKLKKRATPAEVWSAVKKYFPRFLFMIALMSCFNAFSHGSQDLYPVFLQTQHGYGAATTGTIAIVMNLGALCGGIVFGDFSEKLGRKKAIIAAALLALPMIPLWAFSTAPLIFAAGAFFMQFAVQGAWGVVPAHLNELSPQPVRAILPGFSYQIGNLLMSKIGPIQAGLAERNGNDYATVLAWTVAIVSLSLATVTFLGKEETAAEFR